MSAHKSLAITMLAEAQWRWPVVLFGTMAVVAGWIFVPYLGHSTLLLMAPEWVLALAAGGYLVWQATLRRPWALLILLSIAIVLLDVWFRANDRDVGVVGLDAQNGLKILFWMATGIVCLLNMPRIARFLIDPVIAAFFCYGLITILSAVYSSVPLLTATSAIGAITYMLFGCLLASEIDERTLFLVMLWSFAAISLCNLAAVAVPDISYRSIDDPHDIMHMHISVPRFSGIVGAPNTLGEYTSVYAIIIYATAIKRYANPTIWLPHAILAIILLWLSASRTAMLAFITALLLQLSMSWVFVFVAPPLAVIGMLLWSSGALNPVIASIGRDGSSPDDVMTMAGRTDIWDFVLGLIYARPIVGYGFNSFESYASQFWTGQEIAAVAAHNNYLSVMYATGILGLVPFAIGFITLFYRWLTRPNNVRDLFMLNLVISGFTEMGVFSSISPEPALMFMIVLALDTRKNDRTVP